ncbi:4-(cytidine 5'-diphospho)-2-C-methyl-D-erythritol kinase [candidate division GN15 bacterium]|uniref:4-diphosphocytidyl-2-C-methyl-D-erythritol kinase n=1 Tax=candidate division GN15 bacterium TaxID=2072418 RepID=A0A855X9G8_9BACT|nr:MAG: 4-(cytidine 5'-diphospho)-2-C-methyl-D-erythritol kinase [candidate division GN15 bacterium]
MFVKRTPEGSLVIGAPAKVNLFLEILGRRPDGFHNLHSLFQAVSLFDRLTFAPLPDPGLRLTVTGAAPELFGPSNTVVKAYEAVQQFRKFEFGLAVNLEKNIPIGGGLGGGSADAAATVLACNLLLDNKLTNDDMRTIGAQVGSDVPFFFSCGQAIVTGRGEIVEESQFPTDYWLVLITPPLAISTAASYAGLNMPLTEMREPSSLHGCQSVAEFINSLRLTGNDFERRHLETYAVLGKIRDVLIDRGARLVRMSGSGSTMFGIFDTAPEWASEREFQQESWQVNLARPIVLPRIEVNLNGGRPWRSQRSGLL